MSHSPRHCALILCAALFLSCTACGRLPALPGSTPSSSVSAPGSPQEVPPAPGSDVSRPEPTQPSLPEPSAPPASQPEPPVPVTTYDFSQPAPESPAVDNSYFDDAAFVGDSRTDGFMLFSGIKTGKNLSANGLSVFQLATKKCISLGEELYTPLEALSQTQYGKVYLSLGINELGYRNDQSFYQAYSDAVDAIRSCQPNAVIYIQALIPLNEEKIAASGGRDFLKNDHLRIYNDLMRQVAEEKQVVFLDLYSAFGVDGILPYDASYDGVHLSSDYYKQWLAYLKSHTVDFLTLYPSGISQIVPLPSPQPDPPAEPKPAPEVIPL